jgi:hypothetical protein
MSVWPRSPALEVEIVGDCAPSSSARSPDPNDFRSAGLQDRYEGANATKFRDVIAAGRAFRREVTGKLSPEKVPRAPALPRRYQTSVRERRPRRQIIGEPSLALGKHPKREVMSPSTNRLL